MHVANKAEAVHAGLIQYTLALDFGGSETGRFYCFWDTVLLDKMLDSIT